MSRKCKVVELDRRSKTVIPQRILLTDERRVQEGRIRDKVAHEPEDVDSWEIDGRTCGRLSAEVQERLRVEGQRPADGVDPTAELRNDLKKRDWHDRELRSFHEA